jgi:hypothetical protein
LLFISRSRASIKSHISSCILRIHDDDDNDGDDDADDGDDPINFIVSGEDIILEIEVLDIIVLIEVVVVVALSGHAL